MSSPPGSTSATTTMILAVPMSSPDDEIFVFRFAMMLCSPLFNGWLGGALAHWPGVAPWTPRRRAVTALMRRSADSSASAQAARSWPLRHLGRRAH